MPQNSTPFNFKQFSIHQDIAAMKVGTDGILLGAWIDVCSKIHALDVGTGTGLIAMMIAQRNSYTNILGIDIDKFACSEAKENARRSCWKSRINIRHISFQDFCVINHKKYDLIVSNPPFFRNSKKSFEKLRRMARHSDSLSVEDFLNGCTKLLSVSGSFSVIFPFNDYEHFSQTARSNNFFEIRRTTVYPTPHKPPVRTLCEWGLSKPDKMVPNELIIEKYGRHLYSEEYIALTKDFYLNL